MKLLWIGNYEDPETLEGMAAKGYRSSSSQVSQRNLIQGLEAVWGGTLDIISGSVVPEYPVYMDARVKKQYWSHAEGAKDVSVGFLNYKYVNRISCQRAMVRAAREWAKNCNETDVVVFAYSMRSPVMAAAVAVKKYIPTAKIYLIITDLPAYMDLAPSRVKRILKRIDGVQQAKFFRSFDGYILYAEKMAEYLNIKKGMYTVMEGSISMDECMAERPQNIETDKIVVMYSGKVSMNYGIPELLAAFELLDRSKYELWITGTGDASALVEKFALANSSVKYYGFLESRDQLMKLQAKSSMLISTRMPSEEASKYCFPSKLFEYMLTGKPVLTFRIEGIPEEYYSYLVAMKSPDKYDIADTIMHIGSMNAKEREQLGMAGKAFVVSKKSNLCQAQRIWSFVNR